MCENNSQRGRVDAGRLAREEMGSRLTGSMWIVGARDGARVVALG